MNALLAATANGLHRIGSEDVEHSGSVVNALAGTNGEIWVIVEGKEVWRGKERVYTSRDLRLNCVLPAPDGALIGTSEAHLGRISNGDWEVVAGFEDAEGRDDWYTPWRGPPDVRSIAATGDALFVNVHVGGILRSDDAGATWRQTIDIHTDVHEAIAHEGRVLAATAAGLALSGDAGDAWELDDDGLHASYCRAVAVCGDHILISACVGPHGGRAAIYRRGIVSDESFSKCENGLPEWFGDNIDTGCLAASGEQAAFGTSDGEIFFSENSGESWELVAAQLAPVRRLLFT
jgi:hypothetical protein